MPQAIPDQANTGFCAVVASLPAEPKLREVLTRLSEILAPVHQRILGGGLKSQWQPA